MPHVTEKQKYNYTLQEISKILNIPLKEVKNSLQTATRKLEVLLSDEMLED